MDGVFYDLDTGETYYDPELRSEDEKSIDDTFLGSWVDYNGAIDLFRENLQSCSPDECLIIKCGDQIFIEEDCLTNDNRNVWVWTFRVLFNEDVQDILAKWHKYRKAYQKVWNENAPMREALAADPDIPERKLRECIEKSRVMLYHTGDRDE